MDVNLVGILMLGEQAHPHPLTTTKQPQQPQQQQPRQIEVSIPSQMFGGDTLPQPTMAYVSEGTRFMMNGIEGLIGFTSIAQTDRKITWPVGTTFYINNNLRHQSRINQGHQSDQYQPGNRVTLLPNTQITWGGRMVTVSGSETPENRTVELI